MGWVTSLYPYTGSTDRELSFRKGELIEVIINAPNNDEWLEGILDGKRGYFPQNYVQFVEKPPGAVSQLNPPVVKKPEVEEAVVPQAQPKQVAKVIPSPEPGTIPYYYDFCPTQCGNFLQYPPDIKTIQCYKCNTLVTLPLPSAHKPKVPAANATKTVGQEPPPFTGPKATPSVKQQNVARPAVVPSKPAVVLKPAGGASPALSARMPRPASGLESDDGMIRRSKSLAPKKPLPTGPQKPLPVMPRKATPPTPVRPDAAPAVNVAAADTGGSKRLSPVKQRGGNIAAMQAAIAGSMTGGSMGGAPAPIVRSKTVSGAVPRRDEPPLVERPQPPAQAEAARGASPPAATTPSRVKFGVAMPGVPPVRPAAPSASTAPAPQTTGVGGGAPPALPNKPAKPMSRPPPRKAAPPPKPGAAAAPTHPGPAAAPSPAAPKGGAPSRPATRPPASIPPHAGRGLQGKPTLVKAGWLSKKKAAADHLGGRKWKKRWFELSSDCVLKYYADEKRYEEFGEVKGEMVLGPHAACSVNYGGSVTDRENCVVCLCEDGRKYGLQAEGRQDMEEWYKSIMPYVNATISIQLQNELLKGVVWDPETNPFMFKLPLERALMFEGGAKIPYVLLKGMEYVRRCAMEDEGIFRLSGNKDKLLQTKAKLDSGTLVNFDDITDQNVVAALMKLFLREMADPLIPFDMYESILQSYQLEENAFHDMVRAHVDRLPPANRHVLFHLLFFLREVATHCTVNKMGANNLAIVFGPNILRSHDADINPMREVQDAEAIQGVMTFMIEKVEYVYRMNA